MSFISKDGLNIKIDDGKYIFQKNDLEILSIDENYLSIPKPIFFKNISESSSPTGPTGTNFLYFNESDELIVKNSNNQNLSVLKTLNPVEITGSPNNGDVLTATTSSNASWGPVEDNFAFFGPVIDPGDIALTPSSTELTWSAIAENNKSSISLNGSNRILLNDIGIYLITIDILYDTSDGVLKNVRTFLEVSSTELPRSNVYIRLQGSGILNSGSLTYVYNNTSANTALQVFAQRTTTGTGTITVDLDGFRAYVRRLTN